MPTSARKTIKNIILIISFIFISNNNSHANNSLCTNLRNLGVNQETLRINNCLGSNNVGISVNVQTNVSINTDSTGGHLFPNLPQHGRSELPICELIPGDFARLKFIRINGRDFTGGIQELIRLVTHRFCQMPPNSICTIENMDRDVGSGCTRREIRAVTLNGVFLTFSGGPFSCVNNFKTEYFFEGYKPKEVANQITSQLEQIGACRLLRY